MSLNYSETLLVAAIINLVAALVEKLWRRRKGTSGEQSVTFWQKEFDRLKKDIEQVLRYEAKIIDDHARFRKFHDDLISAISSLDVFVRERLKKKSERLENGRAEGKPSAASGGSDGGL